MKFLLIADAWANLGIGMIGPIWTIFVEKVGGDILDAGFAYFVFLLTSGVVMYLISKWEDHVKHKEKLIVISYFLFAIGCFSYLFVHDKTTLLIPQVILGVATAILCPVFDAIYSSYIIKKEETSDWGTWEAMAYIVTAFAALLGSYLANEFGFRILFLFMFLASLIAALVSIGLFRNKKYLNS